MEYKEEITKQYISYNTVSMTNSGNIRVRFKLQLYNEKFLREFAEYIKAFICNPNLNIEIFIKEQQLKLTIKNDTNLLTNSTTANLAQDIKYNDTVNYMLSDLDYGSLLQEFIIIKTENDSEFGVRFSLILNKEEYKDFLVNKNISQYLVNIFKFSDSRYNSLGLNHRLNEVSAVIIAL